MERLFFRLHKLRLLICGLLGLSLTLAIALVPIPIHAAPDPPSVAIATSLAQRNQIVDPLTAGRDLYRAGQFVDAIEQWHLSAHMAAQQGDLVRQVMSWNGMAAAHQSLSQWSQASHAIDQSRTLLDNAPAADPILWGQTLNTQAGLLLNHGGQAAAALDLWQQAETYYQQAQDSSGVLGAQINQAQALQTLGFYRRARQQLEAVAQALQTTPDSDLKISALRSLGQALQLIGSPRESYNALAQSLGVARDLETKAEISSILLNIGKLAAKLESPAQALDYFQAAEAEALIPLDRLQARLNQLAAYVDTHNVSAISAVTNKIQHQLTTLPPSRSTIYGTINLAHNLGRLPHQQLLSNISLSQLLASAVQSARVIKDSRAEAYALYQLGQLYRQDHQGTEALALTQQSLTLAESIQSADIIAQSAWQLGQLLNQQQQRGAAIQAYTKAVESLQTLRGDLVTINQDVQFSYREQVEPVYRELVTLLLAEDNQDSLKQARNVLEDLQVAELDNFFREACLDLEHSDIEQIDTNAVTIYAIILDDQLAVIYSQAHQPLRAYKTPINQATLENTLRLFLASLHPSSDRQEQLSYSQTLYDWLIRPAEQAGTLVPNQTLVFVLDGLLRNLPMAALHDGKHYLIENYAVALSPGLKLIPSRPLDRKNSRAVIAGISESRGRFSALPAVREEVTAIGKLLPAVQLLNQQFTQQALRQKLTNRQVNVLHLATHGQFSSDFSQTFFLTWDGVMNINELSELLQRRESDQGQAIDLLTLSACETATGDERAVLGLAGLAVRSGARSTLATLWSVKDNVAQQLMTSVYGRLGQAQFTKAEALRQAQLELLHSDDFADPFFWSAYVLIGNWL